MWATNFLLHCYSWYRLVRNGHLPLWSEMFDCPSAKCFKQRSVVWQFWIAVLKDGSQWVQILLEYLSRQYLLNHLTLLDKTWYNGASSQPVVTCKMVGFYRQGHSVGSNPQKCTFCDIAWTLKAFCNQIWYSGSLRVGGVTIWDCCQGHSKGANPLGIFVRTIS